ncbi:hypothetical protein GCM10009839_45880 [Catenulispora yoronensis]|uniref:Uncharacterized protein n=1 Tax=Catenulispora yoronensis TaxID=450799 RepID=A0ABP5G4K0_9ACTN
MLSTQGLENWAVEFIQADGEKRSVREGFATQGDAEYFGQCTWAGPNGRGIEEVRVRQLPRGNWQAVSPASVCGGIRL